MRYCESPYFYQRRQAREIVIGDPAHGGVIMGGDHPVVKQSMLTCDTMDTALCVKQTLELVAVGCQLVRITAPTVKDAANLQHIVARIAFAKLPRADRRRHPFQTRGRDGSGEMGRGRPRESWQLRRFKKFAIKEYNDEQYAEELKRIEEKFAPLVIEAKKLKRCHAHRHQPRLVERPHHEPVWRHAAGHGRERAGICAHRAQARFSQLQVLDEVEQPESDDRMLPPPRRATERAGRGLELSDPSRRDRSRRRRRWQNQIRHWHRLSALRRTGRHHPRFAHGRFSARD